MDYDIRPTDTYLAMEKLVSLGLVRSLGLSNFNSVQIQDVLNRSAVKPVINQVESQPYFNQQRLLDFCSSRGIILTAYSPLGSPDRPWATPDTPKLLDDPGLVSLGKKYGKSAAQVVLKWQVNIFPAVI